jgi:predicted Zn-dependent protease with MMP-like domain
MKRGHFVKVVEEVLDSLPQQFRNRIRNLAVLVEGMPPRLNGDVGTDVHAFTITRWIA